MVKAFDRAGGGQVWHFGSSRGPNEWSGSKIPYVWENFGSTNRELLINNPGIAFSQTAREEITSRIGSFENGHLSLGDLRGRNKGFPRAEQGNCSGRSERGREPSPPR